MTDAANDEWEPYTLAQAKKKICSWLHIKDEEILDIVFAFTLSEQIPGDPLWLFLIAPPGGCKTELLRAIDGPDYYHLSDLTSKSFISGLTEGKGKEKRKIEDLLPQLNGKLLIFKDFTTILEKPRDERAEIFAQLREIYDGAFSKKFGTMDQKVAYTSRFGLIAGVTPVIDNYWKLLQQLGERFLKVRWDEDADATTRKAEENEGKEVQMRLEVQDAVMGYLTHLELRNPSLPPELVEPLILASKFLALARTPVKIQAGGSDFFFDYVPMSERPTRLVKQLKKLSKALAMVRNRDVVTREDVLTAIRVALDTVPPDRMAVLHGIEKYQNVTFDGCTVTQIKKSVQLPETSIRHICDQLVLLKMVTETKVQRDRDGWREAINYFKLGEETSALSPLTFLEASKKVEGEENRNLDLFLDNAEQNTKYSVEEIAETCNLEIEECEKQLKASAIKGEVFELPVGYYTVLR